MGGFNEVIGLWSSILGVFTTITTVVWINPKKRRITSGVGIVVTLIVSISLFAFGPEEPVQQVIYNIFNKTVYESTNYEQGIITFTPTYNTYAEALVFRQKVLYTIPLDEEKDNAYEVFRDIPVTDSEIVVTKTTGEGTYSYHVTDEGYIMLNCSIQTPLQLSVSYNGKNYDWTLNRDISSPATYATLVLENSFSQLLLTLKDSSGQYINDKTIYIACEGKEIELSTNYEGMINSYLFLSPGTYSIYTKNDDGEVQIQTILEVPNTNLNETNTIVLS